MSVPYPKPTTRAEARSNAIYSAEHDEFTASQVWSAIAATFPDDPHYSVQPEENSRQTPDEDHRPYPANDETAVLRTEMVLPGDGMGGPMMVNSDLWEVLRFLAASFVKGQPDRRLTIDMQEINAVAGWYNVNLIRMPDEPVIHVVYEGS